MITFKQFLSEAETSELKEMIERDCADFLRESKKQGFLYRGIQHNPDVDDHHVTDIDGNRLVYIVKSVRSDRKPRDTMDRTHRSLNIWFSSEFGWKPRTEGVFCFGENFPKNIVEYGDPHIIFPIGEMKYVWSNQISDLYVDMDAHEVSNVEDGELFDWLNDREYKETGLDRAVTNECEIMVKCAKYYAFPVEYKDELKKSLGFK